jgi:hypothetical protein
VHRCCCRYWGSSCPLYHGTSRSYRAHSALPASFELLRWAISATAAFCSSKLNLFLLLIISRYPKRSVQRPYSRYAHSLIISRRWTFSNVNGQRTHGQRTRTHVGAKTTHAAFNKETGARIGNITTFMRPATFVTNRRTG